MTESSSQAVLDNAVDTAPVQVRTSDWITIVLNDPVNLMSYVSYVFTSYFGYTKSQAEALMLQVHERGRATVARGSREKMERDTLAMHEYGLWAQCRPADADASGNGEGA